MDNFEGNYGSRELICVDFLFSIGKQKQNKRISILVLTDCSLDGEGNKQKRANHGRSTNGVEYGGRAVNTGFHPMGWEGALNPGTHTIREGWGSP